MKTFLIVLLLAVLSVFVVSAPVNDTSTSTKKGPQFISSFDEIVVESSLVVRGKDKNARQGKKLVVITPKTTTAAADTTTTAKTST